MKYQRIILTFLTTCGLSFAAVLSLAADLPDFGQAKIVEGGVEGGKVAIERFMERKELRTITTPLPPGLKIIPGPGTTVGPVSRTTMATVIESQTTYVELDKVVARRVNGAVVSPQVLAKELAEFKEVIILEADGPIALPISKLFAPEALILVVPPLDAPTLIVPPPTQAR